MTKNDLINFENASELKRDLTPYLASVGSRKVRTRIQRERYGLAGYLLTAASRGILNFPLQVKHRDCPDWEISDGISMVGLEVTEHKSDNYGKFLKALEDSNCWGECEPFVFPKDQQPMEEKAIIEIANRKTLREPPVMGDGYENAWGHRVAFTASWKSNIIANYADLKMYDYIDLCIVDIRPERIQYGRLEPKHLAPVFQSKLHPAIRKVFCVDSSVCEFYLEANEWWCGRLE